jgi:hypothetical protein
MITKTILTLSSDIPRVITFFKILVVVGLISIVWKFTASTLFVRKLRRMENQRSEMQENIYDINCAIKLIKMWDGYHRGERSSFQVKYWRLYAIGVKYLHYPTDFYSFGYEIREKDLHLVMGWLKTKGIDIGISRVKSNLNYFIQYKSDACIEDLIQRRMNLHRECSKLGEQIKEMTTLSRKHPWEPFR